MIRVPGRLVPGWLAETGIGPRALLAVGVAGALAAGFWPIDPGAAPEGPARPPLDLARLASLDDGEALRRPIFDPERRDWTAGGSLDDVLGRGRPSVTLTLRGVMIDQRAKRAFVDDGTPDAGWLGLGEGRGSWRIAAIERDRVVVSQSGRRHALDFLGAPVRLPPARVLQREAPPEDPAILRPAL